MGKGKKQPAPAENEILNIPEDEIWTYRIDGLQAPRIVDKTVKTKTKLLIVTVLVAAISLSIFFSIRAVSNEEYKFTVSGGVTELTKYSNPGNVREVTVDKTPDGDPVTKIREYAFNCDEKLFTVRVGKDVSDIDGKAFFSCGNLECVFVDDANEYYTDIDGVLYTKDLTKIVYYPSAHNVYLTRQLGYTVDFPENGSITGDDFSKALDLLDRCVTQGEDPAALTGDDKTTIEKFVKLTGVTDHKKFITEYNEKVGVYVLPSAVNTVGKLALAYSDIREIYLPEGLKSIETLGFFKAEKLKEIYSYTSETEITDTVYGKVKDKIKAVRSLPDGLESIGSDAFTYDRGITYMFVPSGVKEIGHHAFYNMAYKSGDEIQGLAQVNVQADKSTFKEVDTGESWLPKVDAGLFEKNIEVIYSSQREK